jgi:hypothetical protein
MGRAERESLIKELEETRGSKVLCYVTGDRNPAPAQIGDDALRPMYDHLRALGHVKKLDLFVYSRGGAIDVPWRIVSALRTWSDEWDVLVPFRAQSAATLVALGADNIVLGPHGELGPIDPILNIQRFVQMPGGPQGTLVQETVSVEDVMAYVRFVQTRAGLSDQDALAVSLGRLADRLDAVALGNVYRTHSHIRDVARRILLSRRTPASEQTLATIIETLAERVYAHGHAIGLKSAQEIGLPVRPASPEEDRVMWALLTDYESEMKLREPLDPAAAISATDLYSEDATIAVIESREMVHGFIGAIEVRAKRQMPPTLSVTFNVNLQFPPGVNAANLSEAVQQQLQLLLQQAQQLLSQGAQDAVQAALRKQAPVVGLEASLRGGMWRRLA